MTTLSKKRAADADEAIERVMAAAARQVTTTRCDLDEALINHWAAVREQWPSAWKLATQRLRETDNREMLALAIKGEEQADV